MNSMKRQKDRTVKDELPRLASFQSNTLLEMSGEITPERMKSQSLVAKLGMCFIILFESQK